MVIVMVTSGLAKVDYLRYWLGWRHPANNMIWAIVMFRLIVRRMPHDEWLPLIRHDSDYDSMQ